LGPCHAGPSYPSRSNRAMFARIMGPVTVWSEGHRRRPPLAWTGASLGIERTPPSRFPAACCAGRKGPAQAEVRRFDFRGPACRPGHTRTTGSLPGPGVPRRCVPPAQSRGNGRPRQTSPLLFDLGLRLFGVRI
jgi:hypothetical protein